MTAIVQSTPDIGGVDLVREDTRRMLAFLSIGGFLVLTAFIVVAGLILGQLGSAEVAANLTAAKDFLTAFGSVFGGVVGAVVGFYFGSEQ